MKTDYDLLANAGPECVPRKVWPLPKKRSAAKPAQFSWTPPPSYQDLFDRAVEQFHAEHEGAMQPSQAHSKLTKHQDGGATVWLRNSSGPLAIYEWVGDEGGRLVEAEAKGERRKSTNSNSYNLGRKTSNHRRKRVRTASAIPSEAELRMRWAKQDDEVTDCYFSWFVRVPENEEERLVVEKGRVTFRQARVKDLEPFRRQMLEDRKTLIAQGVPPADAHAQAEARAVAIARREDSDDIDALVRSGLSVNTAVERLDRLREVEHVIEALNEQLQSHVDEERDIYEEISEARQAMYT